jgi:hypothetical protein
MSRASVLCRSQKASITSSMRSLSSKAVKYDLIQAELASQNDDKTSWVMDNPSVSSDELLERAVASYSYGDSSRAYVLLLEACRINPRDGRIWSYLGRWPIKIG